MDEEFGSRDARLSSARSHRPATLLRQGIRVELLMRTRRGRSGLDWVIQPEATRVVIDHRHRVWVVQSGLEDRCSIWQRWPSHMRHGSGHFGVLVERLRYSDGMGLRHEDRAGEALLCRRC